MHLDGSAIRSCVFPAVSAVGHRIVTLEGLGTPEKPRPLQQAFIDEQAVQCGYCINGMNVMQAAALASSNKNPTDAQIKQALAYNLCRCGTHLRIVRAVRRVPAAAPDEKRLMPSPHSVSRREILKFGGLIVRLRPAGTSGGGATPVRLLQH